MNIKIGKECYVPTEQIRFVCGAKTTAARKHLEYAKALNKPIFRITQQRRPAACVVVMCDFSIYITDMSVQTVSKNINKEDD